MSTDTIILERRLSEIEATMAELKQEAESIHSALAVFKRYASSTLALNEKNDLKQEDTAEPAKGKPRPSGTPTHYEMAVLVLKDAGPSGLTGTEIVERIRARYWPGAAGSQILPSVYRFLKEKRILKIRGRFLLPPEQSTFKKSEPEKGDSGSVGV
jgi:hypothetical protein